MDGEQGLAELKWFDYRPLAPDTATLAFVCEHVKGLARQLEYLGEERAWFKAHGSVFGKGRKLNPAEPHAWKHWTLFERLRRLADQHFMRYDLFWAMAFEAYNEFGWGAKQLKGKGYGFIPFNYFGNRTMLSRVKAGYEEYTRRFLVKSHLPFFRPESFTGHPFQVGYWRYVAGEIKKRYPSRWRDRLAELTEEGQFPRDTGRLILCVFDK